MVLKGINFKALAHNKHVAVQSGALCWSQRNWINSTEQIPSEEADSHSAGQEIPNLIWNPKVCHCVHKIMPLDPVLSQTNPVCIFTSYFFKINFNIIFLFLDLPSGCFSPSFSD